MFDTPVETWYVWAGLAVVSVVVLSLALNLPRTPPPDAVGVAESVDSVAASAHPATATHSLTVDAVRVGPYRVWLRDDGTTGHAVFAYGPVTPVRRGTALWDVLQGAPPDQAFASPAAFRRATSTARDRDPEWRTVDELTVRTVSWEGVDVTLVG
jgi:hypothetical protein